MIKQWIKAVSLLAVLALLASCAGAPVTQEEAVSVKAKDAVWEDVDGDGVNDRKELFTDPDGRKVYELRLDYTPQIVIASYVYFATEDEFLERGVLFAFKGTVSSYKKVYREKKSEVSVPETNEFLYDFTVEEVLYQPEGGDCRAGDAVRVVYYCESPHDTLSSGLQEGDRAIVFCREQPQIDYKFMTPDEQVKVAFTTTFQGTVRYQGDEFVVPNQFASLLSLGETRPATDEWGLDSRFLSLLKAKEEVLTAKVREMGAKASELFEKYVEKNRVPVNQGVADAPWEDVNGDGVGDIRAMYYDRSGNLFYEARPDLVISEEITSVSSASRQTLQQMLDKVEFVFRGTLLKTQKVGRVQRGSSQKPVYYWLFDFRIDEIVAKNEKNICPEGETLRVSLTILPGEENSVVPLNVGDQAFVFCTQFNGYSGRNWDLEGERIRSARADLKLGLIKIDPVQYLFNEEYSQFYSIKGTPAENNPCLHYVLYGRNFFEEKLENYAKSWVEARFSK